MPIEYASFLIRLWREQSPKRLVVSYAESLEPTADWQGEVEHIQSGQRWTFSALDELLGLLRQQAETPISLERTAGE